MRKDWGFTAVLTIIASLTILASLTIIVSCTQSVQSVKNSPWYPTESRTPVVRYAGLCWNGQYSPLPHHLRTAGTGYGVPEQ